MKTLGWVLLSLLLISSCDDIAPLYSAPAGVVVVTDVGSDTIRAADRYRINADGSLTCGNSRAALFSYPAGRWVRVTELERQK